MWRTSKICARWRSAFSLVEIAIAIGIVSFVLVALLGLMASSFESARSAKEDTVIAALAREMLANVIDSTGDDLNGTALTFDETGAPNTETEAILYTCHIQVGAVSLAASRPELAMGRQVRVEISRTPGGMTSDDTQVFTTVLR